MPLLGRRRRNDWIDYWDREPWGEKREDWRQMAYFARWAAMFSGSSTKPPNPVWPYIDPEDERDIEEMMQRAANFDDAIEPNPGGGYRYKAGREPRLDGNDNR